MDWSPATVSREPETLHGTPARRCATVGVEGLPCNDRSSVNWISGLVLAARFPAVQFLYPVHLNPQVHGPVRQALAGLTNVRLADPAPYPEFVWLMDRATVILTDSGGIQEEAPSLGKPVLVLRDTTERPEALTSGAIELVGTDVERIVDRVAALLDDPAECERRRAAVNPYGDGHAAGRILDLIAARAWLA